jgi:hypothetical protein
MAKSKTMPKKRPSKNMRPGRTAGGGPTELEAGGRMGRKPKSRRG